MRLSIFERVCAMSVLALLLLGGCQNAETATAESEHGHTHAPTTGPKNFADAVAKLKEINGEINTAMQNDDPDAAHDPLHNVGNLLKGLPELAADTDLSEDDWAEVKAESTRVFDAFGEVDKVFHSDGDKKGAYESQKSTIEDGITKLAGKLAASGSVPSSHDHDDDDDDDHDEHDHDDHDEHEHDHEKDS